jgi:hypothetical protein
MADPTGWNVASREESDNNLAFLIFELGGRKTSLRDKGGDF